MCLTYTNAIVLWLQSVSHQISCIMTHWYTRVLEQLNSFQFYKQGCMCD